MKRRALLQALSVLLGVAVVPMAAAKVPAMSAAAARFFTGLPRGLKEPELLAVGGRFYRLRRAPDPAVCGWDQFEVMEDGSEQFVGWVSDEHLVETGRTPEEDLRAWAGH